ncbi:MAG TPA: glutathione synthase [Polyangiaceae bacterium]|nr:glutathione synthase [Polyangiaceae bacterium]
MRFVFVMDTLDRVTPDKDTTYAFIEAAQARGHESLHCLPSALGVRRGRAFATTRGIRVSNAAPRIELFGEPREVTLESDVDAVFIRKDPPFDQAYLYATLVLENARGGPIIVNDPRGLRDANEKLYAMHFPEWTPATLVASDRDAIFRFVEEVGGDAVIKPLDGAGGSGVMMLRKGDKNARAIVDLLTGEGQRLAMVQEFLPAVTVGDKRVLLLDGEPLGAILRVPRGDDLRSNIHVGGSVVPAELTAKEQELVRAIAPRLRADGLVFVGLDVIGERLTEVNVTSPTGIQELGRFTGTKPAARVIEWVEKRRSAGAAQA